MPASNVPMQIDGFEPGPDNVEDLLDDGKNRNTTDFATQRRRLLAIRILPPMDGDDASLTSDKLAQAIMQQANDPQSKLRNTIGLEGILGAFLAPRGIDPGP